MIKKVCTKAPWVFLMILCAGIGLATSSESASTAEPATTATQDVMRLEQRITSLEQKIYPLESTIRRLEQQTSSISRPTPTPTLRDPELDRLRSDIEVLKARLRELECGLVHVDERTLSPAMKEARRRLATQGGDPCRANPETPVQLSTR